MQEKTPPDPLYAPGLKRRPRKGGVARYWIPPAKDVKLGYGLKSRRIPDNMTELQAATFCRECWADLEQWRNGLDGPQHSPGTWNWVIWHMRNDDQSPMKRVHARKGRPIREKTQVSYEYSMRIIENSIGRRKIESTTGPDLLRWYDNYAKPKNDADPYLTKAKNAMGQLRRLASYAVFLGHKPAYETLHLFETVRFPGTAQRMESWSFENITKLINRAIKDGYLSIAITTLAQYEFTERRIHIIGEWSSKGEDAIWRPGWLWEGIQYGQRVGINKEWQLTYFQDKSQPTRRSFDLHDTPALLDLLERIPEAERTGAVINCEATGKPWRLRHYGRKFREVARAAKLPDNFWSMDMRASAATEADGIPGVTMRELQDAGGWTNQQTVARYRRDKERNAVRMVQRRQAHRGKK